ncbi:S-adenosyl-L-methionine-dependent methyltransferase [Phialemonium atrogriseum]|uniref:S-adenosyl-L-methionine-dependent methyltransferase n=1 Tax=Phialemonium atrogriseum TaxID=1093897 RepID=A0AAJ0C2F4_9PEZI|nr:S-adenosyl-L-methionine-dependent methyltransferase [Phialemonium atrogriseum]KAK1767868.1 S-adenosyl-L-methionine-dependent methyltransferase [Phialemonium atrogriseum]
MPGNQAANKAAAEVDDGVSNLPTSEDSVQTAIEQPAAAEAPPPNTTTETDILGPQQWMQLAEGTDPQDYSDSTLGDNASSSASIASTIFQYRTIHGRTYHSDHGNAQYWGTNDDKQNEAMDINHHVLTLLIGDKLYLAPLPKDIQKVVDIGTGTGIWAIDFADEFPNTRVIGTDISPIQPSWVPPNLEFQIDDCTQKEWAFPRDSLDYVHMRWLVGSIVDWTALFKHAYNSLKPGGFIESHEASPYIVSDDGSIHETSAMNQWGKFFVEGGRKMGRSFTVVKDGTQRKAMEEAGFVDIEEANLKNPLGGWPRDPKLSEIGKYTQLALEQDIEGTVLFMANSVGWTKMEIGVYIAHLRRELRSRKFHPYFWQKVVWGRKPTA